MNERLDFADNRNGKLNCQCFSLFRLHNPIRNCVGAVKHIYLKGIYKGDAKVMHVSRLTLDAVTLPMTKLDSGLLPEEFRGNGVRIEDDVLVTADGVENLSADFHRSRPGIDWTKQQVDFIVMEYLIDSKEPSLF